jgi:4'-phosphopantetheinyl transferase
LRAVLTSCLGAPVDAWRFSIDENGKPGIDGSLAADDVAFNLSHTRGLVAVALASHGAIGVDVEEIDAAKADLAVAAAYFAPAEAAVLRRTPAADRTLCFHRLWTLKEAYLKAIGAGLGAPLDSFAFTLEPIRIDLGAGGDAAQWRFATLATTGRHVLSVAASWPAGETVRFTPCGLAPADL